MITLGRLNDEYESFVTSITTRYDPSLTFSELCELLMDHEMRKINSKSSNITPAVNFAAKTATYASNRTQSFPNKMYTQGSKSEIKCQICSRKGHGVADCYNRLNISRFPPSHNRTLSSSGPNGGNRGSVNTLTSTFSESKTVWYPDSGATSHITSTHGNIQKPRAYNGNIYTANGSPIFVNQSGWSIV